MTGGIKVGETVSVPGESRIYLVRRINGGIARVSYVENGYMNNRSFAVELLRPADIKLKKKNKVMINNFGNYNNDKYERFRRFIRKRIIKIPRGYRYYDTHNYNQNDMHRFVKIKEFKKYGRKITVYRDNPRLNPYVGIKEFPKTIYYGIKGLDRRNTETWSLFTFIKISGYRGMFRF